MAIGCEEVRSLRLSCAYEFLGTWAIAIDHGVGSSEIHNVYGRLARSPRTTKGAISPMERY